MSSYPTRHREFQTNRKKTQKIKKHDYDFIQKPKQVGNGQERGKKKIVPMSYYRTRNREFQKKSKKLKNTFMTSFQAKIGWKWP